jgi:hypothetical protein
VPPDRGAAFDEFARPLEASIWQLRQESATLAAVRDVLLPELISGRIRMSDAADFDEATAASPEALAAPSP